MEGSAGLIAKVGRSERGEGEWYFMFGYGSDNFLVESNNSKKETILFKATKRFV